MAHFAKVVNGKVVKVIVAEQEIIDSGHLGDQSQWFQTSYNTRGGVHYDPNTGEPSADQTKAIRKNFAGVDYNYSPILDAFYPPQPHVSWTLNEDTCLWEPPVAKPIDDKLYLWDEEQLNWVEFVKPSE